MAPWQNPENFALWLAVTIVLIIALLFVFIRFTHLYIKRILKEEQKLKQAEAAYQAQLLEDSILIQERERTRIAAELHDGLISKLTTSLLVLNIHQDTTHATQILQDSITLARHISHDLAPPSLAQYSLWETLTDFLYAFEEQYQILIHKSVYTQPHTLHTQTKTQIFRIVQEIIQNIVKHANATEIKIWYRKTSKYLALKIQDNGVGLKNNSQKGLGLKNIHLRVEMLKGVFRLTSPTNQGTSFILLVKNKNV